MKKQSDKDLEVMFALIDQVTKSVPKKSGASEQSVTTVITRPLWRRWCRAVGVPVNSKPTAWLGVGKTLRVYGSETIVVESKRSFAVSFIKP